MKYHHMGVPTSSSRDREEYIERFKMFHTSLDDNPYGFEFLRFEPDCPVPEIVQRVPHIAFKVENLEEALRDREIIMEPNNHSLGVQVAYILYEGMPVELLEYDESAQIRDFPELESARLRLRQIRSSDADVLFRLRTDPRVMKYLDTAPLLTMRDSLEMINVLSLRFIEEQIPLWAVVLKEEKGDQMIGYIGYSRRNKAQLRAEVSTALDPDYWGRGIVHEATELVLQYGFQHMGLHSIEASANPLNTKSIRILERLGFQLEGLFKEKYHYDGKFPDDAIYSLLKPADE